MADPRPADLSAAHTADRFATEGQRKRRRSHRIMVVAVALNLMLLLAAVFVYLLSDSQLVLAQGSDSLLDIAAGVILTISVSVGSQPRDDDHHFGHQRAEPIGALITAVLAGVLGFEVLRSASWSLATGMEADMDIWVLSVLATKFAVKATMLAYLKRTNHGTESSALKAVRVDTRNDVFACASSLTGFALARSGLTWADAALAIPIGLYIGYNGLDLARENLRYLMGEAPPEKVIDELRELAAGVRGIIRIRNVRAQYVGQQLHAEITILIDEDRTATQGHDIALEVQNTVEQHPLIDEVFVHVDTRAAKSHA